MSGATFDRIVGIIGAICGLLGFLLNVVRIKKIKILEKLKVGFIYITIPAIVWLFMIDEFSIQFGKGNAIQFDPRLIIIIISILLIRLLQIQYLKRIQTPQFEKAITVKSKNNPDIKMDLKKLRQDNDKERVALSWATFIESMKILKEKICMSGGTYPDIFFGINEAGVMIATYLSFFTGGRPPVGIIKTKAKFKDKNRRERRQIVQFDCPNATVPQFDGSPITSETVLHPRLIAVVDSEIKTGNSSEQIINMLKTKYPDSEFLYICLGGVIKPEHRGRTIDDIKCFGWDIVDENNKPDIIAFCVDSPGFEAPDGIR